MKLFFDANVLIAAFASRGYTYDVIKDAMFRYEVYCTEYVLQEVHHNLSAKFSLSKQAIEAIMYTLKSHFIRGKAADTVDKVCRDDNDNQILADALVNEIEIIITGDKDLLEIKNYKGIKIITPKHYWKL
ncbi:MAG: putative toxin-antitoxin system toxin component, PIN family [Candidatus Ratteibacteria bacterium]|nr:putative toxin-antitoxin system toxin component, PIN family [Candidatus Ratteibacteria bacterium]